MSIQRPERIFTGKVASPGLVAGRLRVHVRQAASEISAGSPVEEALRLDRALSEAAAQLGQLSDKVEGRRFVELLGSEDEHVWRMFEEELVSHDKELLLGDEPLQGAEDLKK